MKTQSLLIILIILSLFLIATLSITYNTLTGASISHEETIIIPIKAHILIEERGVYSSARRERNIMQLFRETNRIWEQANIHFQLEEVVKTEINFGDVPNAINGNYKSLENHKNFDKNKINVFLTQSLNNINGLALMRIQSTLISDHTTVNDFRTNAHEFGHLLGLKHVPPSTSLMSRGRNGEHLSTEEIQTTRQNAQMIFAQSPLI